MIWPFLGKGELPKYTPKITRATDYKRWFEYWGKIREKIATAREIDEAVVRQMHIEKYFIFSCHLFVARLVRVVHRRRRH